MGGLEGRTRKGCHPTAGTTAMEERRDATLEAMRLAAALDERLRILCDAWEYGAPCRLRSRFTCRESYDDHMMYS